MAVVTGTLINFVPGPLYIHGAMWSLSVEFQFYFAYAAFLVLLLVFRASRPCPHIHMSRQCHGRKGASMIAIRAKLL